MDSSQHYRTVFDISQKSFDWWFPLAGLGFVIIGVVLIWVGRRNRWPLSKSWVAYFMVVFASLWSIGSFAGMYSSYSELQTSYRDGRFAIVEGQVHDFHPMPYEGHQDECFSVQTNTFCYSDYNVSAGFNNSTSHGGPIREGLPIRIGYVSDTILLLQVKDGTGLSAEERGQNVQSAKASSEKRVQNDPVTRHMMLAFGLASVFLTGWWTLQWQRFMRLWIKPPYRPATILLFRVFFAANLVGSIWYLIAQLSNEALSKQEYLSSIEIGSAMIGVIWTMFSAVEWINRKKP